MNHAPSATAAELLKAHGSDFPRMQAARWLRKLAIEKGWADPDVKFLARSELLGTMIQQCLNRVGQVKADNHAVSVFKYIGMTFTDHEPAKTETYRGSHDQNKRIDSAFRNN